MRWHANILTQIAQRGTPANCCSMSGAICVGCSALNAKATANGRAEDPALAELEREANRLLAQRPTPLEPLRRVVADYQERLL